MQVQTIYDYELVDSIREQEKKYLSALERAKESVRLLSASIERLKEFRLSMEAANDD
jgi:hypothetical protein